MTLTDYYAVIHANVTNFTHWFNGSCVLPWWNINNYTGYHVRPQLWQNPRYIDCLSYTEFYALWWYVWKMWDMFWIQIINNNVYSSRIRTVNIIVYIHNIVNVFLAVLLIMGVVIYVCMIQTKLFAKLWNSSCNC